MVFQNLIQKHEPVPNENQQGAHTHKFNIPMEYFFHKVAYGSFVTVVEIGRIIVLRRLMEVLLR